MTKVVARDWWSKSENAPEVVKWRKNAASLRATADRVTGELKNFERERAGLDITRPDAASRVGKLDIEITARVAILKSIDQAVSDAEGKASLAFKAARRAGIAALRLEEVRVKDRAVRTMAALLDLAEAMRILHSQLTHLGDGPNEHIDEAILSKAQGEVTRWLEQKRDYPHKFAHLPARRKNDERR